MLDEVSISVVLEALRPERAALLAVLERLSVDEWSLPTECPSYGIQGIATHLLGDDLSLLSRQRDGAVSGLARLAPELPGADFRTLLDTFNDRWVAAAQFLSPTLVVELLLLTGSWTADYYEAIDPGAPGEPVTFFGAHGQSSPFWQAIAREYLERWVHHSQIRRALGLGSLADESFVEVGLEVAAAAIKLEPFVPHEHDGVWALGPVVLGSTQQAAAVLTRAHTPVELRALLEGPIPVVKRFSTFAGRPS